MNTAGLRTGRAYSKVVRAAAQLKRYNNKIEWKNYGRFR